MVLGLVRLQAERGKLQSLFFILAVVVVVVAVWGLGCWVRIDKL